MGARGAPVAPWGDILKEVVRFNSIAVVIFLLLTAVSTSWCAADCVAQTLAPATCHHEENPKVCDDPTTVVPDSALPTPAFDFEPLFSVVTAPAPLNPAVPTALFPPSPPLRI